MHLALRRILFLSTVVVEAEMTWQPCLTDLRKMLYRRYVYILHCGRGDGTQPPCRERRLTPLTVVERIQRGPL
jgi:hypothetical protein